MFADADDMLLPGSCATAIGLIEKTKNDIVQFSVDFEAKQENLESLERFARVFRSRAMESHDTVQGITRRNPVANGAP